MQRVRAEIEWHEVASHEYEATGLQILELAQTAHFCTLRRIHMNRRDCHNATIELRLERGSLSPTYNKPFDFFAKGTETGDWLLRLDSNQQPSG